MKMSGRLAPFKARRLPWRLVLAPYEGARGGSRDMGKTDGHFNDHPGPEHPMHRGQKWPLSLGWIFPIKKGGCPPAFLIG